MSSLTTEENCENTCVVCFKNVEIFSIGECDHPVCYECSTRMRVLCRQTECPICRHDMRKVIFTKNVRLFKVIKDGSYLCDRKFKIEFDTAKVRQAYDTLLAHVCQKCPERIAFQNFLLLKEHMRRNHELFYCELCVENLKILTCERRCYTRSELEIHRKKGDPDDKSHKGHPLCKFCDKRYMDKDELCRHLRRDHLFCHFCDADGYNQYYSSYDSLRDHFRSEHYLCEEGACYEEKFTAVFRTDIDLKAHRASVHGRTIGKAATKQARTLELAFRLAPRPGVEYRHGRNTRNPRYVSPEEWEDEGAVGGLYDEEQNYYNSNRSSGLASSINTDCIDEFPSLGGSSMNSQVSTGTRKPTSNVTIRAAVQGGKKLAITDENFPALGPEATVSFRVNSSSSERPKSTGAVTKSQPTNFSIHVNHRPNSVMTRVTSSSGGPSSSNCSSVSSSSNSNFRPKEDFPALCNAKMSQPVLQIASSQWSSGKEPESKVSLVKNNAQSQLPLYQKGRQNFSIERDNFPQLSSRFETGCNVRPDTKSRPNSRQQYVPETKLKKATSLTVPVNDPWIPLLTREQANSGNISGDSEVSNKTGSKKKKKKSGGKNSGNNSSSGNDSKSSLKKSDGDSSRNNLDNDSKKKKKQKSQSNNNSKEAGNKSESLSARNGVERKRTELKISKLVDESDESANPSINNNYSNIKNNNNNETPVLSKTSSMPPGYVDITREKQLPPGYVDIPKEKPPPGFETTGKPSPPPGFSIKLNSIARPPNTGNGLTFTNSSGQSYPIKPGSNNLTPTSHTYVPPVNFAPRNGDLVESVMRALKDSTKLDEFRNMSLKFRQSLLSAKDYYNHCQQAMGSDFESIFPELIVLLPDIVKQQELWTVHQMLSKPTSSTNVSKKSKLDVCTVCRQVLNASDLPEHQTSHLLENDFPLLSNGISNGSWTKK